MSSYPGNLRALTEEDWEAYRRKVGSIADSPHQAAMAEEQPSRKRNTREAQKDG